MTKEFARRPSVAGLALWGPVHKWRFSVLAFSSHVLLVGENTKNVSAGKGVVTQLC